MSGRLPFLPIYSHKGYNFSMEDTRKGYLLSKIVYMKVRDWTSGEASPNKALLRSLPPTRPPLPPLLPRAFHKLLGNFWKLLVFRAKFFVLRNFLYNF